MNLPLKNSFSSLLVLIVTATSLRGEEMGGINFQEGMPLPINKGVTWEYEGHGYVQAFIHDEKFTVVFLDSNKNLLRIPDIVQVTVNSRIIPGDGQFYPYHLNPSSDGLYFQNDRHVYHPHHYEIEVFLRKEVPRFFSRPKRVEKRFVRPDFELKILDQR